MNVKEKGMNDLTEREHLEAKYGKVWDTKELQKDFFVEGFLAPFVSVNRKSDNVKGTLEFQHSPRFYFNFSDCPWGTPTLKT